MAHRGAALWVLALMAASLPLSAGVDGPDTPPRQETGQAPEERERHFALKVSLEGRYDDNILQLSDPDKEDLKDNTDPDRFRIETADDTIAVGRIDLRWRGRPIRRRATSAVVSLDAYSYARNGVKDYQELGVSLSQEITASRHHLGSLRLRFSRTPNFYLRQLTDDDASIAAMQRIREALTYSQDEYTLSYRQEIINGRLEGRLGWSHRERNFNRHFDERDNTRRGWSVALQGHPFGGSPIELSLAYEKGALRARGDLSSSSPFIDDDISYRFRGIIFEAAIPWATARRGRLEIDLRREWRDFTTDNPYDISHSERDDDRRDYRARLVQALGRGLDLVAEIRRRSNDAAFPVAFTASEEVTDFVENLVTVGLAWNHRF
jgi:hypothetical protein